jgi:asparagine synthase (glutamine-hydrolysing)
LFAWAHITEALTMANFVIIVDPEERRRSSFIDKVRPLLPIVEGLTQSGCSTGDFASAWACESRAPVTQVTRDGESTVLWGEAIPGPGPERITAPELQKVWVATHANPPAMFDGFYAGVSYSRERGLIVGADPLGIFPVYYWSAEDVALVASSPEPFRYHPLFRLRFNPAGLVGILLTGRLLDGHQLLWRDVRRLGAGRALVYRPGEPVREVQQYEVRASRRYFDLPLAGHVSILENALGAAIARHVLTETFVTLALSGGLDSRILGGFLREQGVRLVAATNGVPTDTDMQCAIRVARALQCEHRTLPDSSFSCDRFLSAAEREAGWVHLVGGFNSFNSWVIYPELRQLPSPVVAGYFMTHVLGGCGILLACSPTSASLSFDNFFGFINTWGFRPAVLKTLLRREVFEDLVEDTIAQARRVYESYSDLESQRAWCFTLLHDQRFFVGRTAWQLSFGAWPVYPGTDRTILDIAAGMPAAALAERRPRSNCCAPGFRIWRNYPSTGTTPIRRRSGLDSDGSWGTHCDSA